MFIMIETLGKLVENRKTIVNIADIKTIEENKNKDSNNHSLITLKGGDQLFCKKTVDNIQRLLYDKGKMI